MQALRPGTSSTRAVPLVRICRRLFAGANCAAAKPRPRRQMTQLAALIGCAGSRGDVQPFMHLGQELQLEHGWRVVLAAGGALRLVDTELPEHSANHVTTWSCHAMRQCIERSFLGVWTCLATPDHCREMPGRSQPLHASARAVELSRQVSSRRSALILPMRRPRV